MKNKDTIYNKERVLSLYYKSTNDLTTRLNIWDKYSSNKTKFNK